MFEKGDRVAARVEIVCPIVTVSPGTGGVVLQVLPTGSLMVRFDVAEALFKDGHGNWIICRGDDVCKR